MKHATELLHDAMLREFIELHAPMPRLEFEEPPLHSLCTHPDVVGTAYDALVQGQMGDSRYPFVGENPEVDLYEHYIREAGGGDSMDVYELMRLHQHQPPSWPPQGLGQMAVTHDQYVGVIDVLTDDAVIDIKTGSNPLTFETWMQLLLYNQFLSWRSEAPRALQVYGARHGELITLASRTEAEVLRSVLADYDW